MSAQGSVARTWLHYARKERERAELMDFIRHAREKGVMPPSKAARLEENPPRKIQKEMGGVTL